MALLRNDAIKKHPAIRRRPTSDQSWEVFLDALDEQKADSTVSAYKDSVTSRASTTTLADDPDLQVVLKATSAYRVNVRVFFNAELATTGNQGFNFGMSYTGTNSILSHGMGIEIVNGTAAVSTGALGVFTVTSPIPSGVTPIAVSPNIDGFDFSYFVKTNTAGTLSVQWAQQSSSADETNVVTGSYLVALRLD